SADGDILYACINDKLYRGTSSESKIIHSAKVQPTAVVAGEGAVTISCTAPKGAAVTIDLVPLGGPAAQVMTEEPSSSGADSIYTLKLPEISPALFGQKDRKGAPLPGRVPLSITAAAAGQSES